LSAQPVDVAMQTHRRILRDSAATKPMPAMPQNLCDSGTATPTMRVPFTSPLRERRAGRCGTLGDGPDDARVAERLRRDWIS